MEMIMRTIEINSKKINIDGMKSTIFFIKQPIFQFDISFNTNKCFKKQSIVLNLPYKKWTFTRNFPFINQGADLMYHTRIQQIKVEKHYKRMGSALIDEIEYSHKKGKNYIFIANLGFDSQSFEMLFDFIQANFHSDLNIYLFLPDGYERICLNYGINMIYL
jgi:hypothetical protein